jgi:hypothetical protein
MPKNLPYAENNFLKKIYIKKMQFRTLLFPLKKVHYQEENIFKQSVQPSKSLSYNGFVINAL